MTLALVAVVTCLASAAAPAVAATTKDVTVVDNAFSPDTIAVMPADSVRWTYAFGGGPHNVVFEDGAFVDPAVPTFPSWTATRTFASAGTFRYYCVQHGSAGGVGMAGVVHVNTTANLPPRAVLSAVPGLVEVNATVTFSAGSSTDPDGTITKYEWDLDGNGTYEVDSGTTATTTRSYATPGTRSTQLRVTDNGATSTVSDIRPVVVTNAPSASFTISPNPAPSGQAVVFDASASADADGSIGSYEWDLDGNTSYDVFAKTPTTSQAFTGPRTLTITLRVADNHGFGTTTSLPLQVLAPLPPPPPPPAGIVPPAPPPAAVAASVSCSTLAGAARATCMQKACTSLTGAKKATCINSSCRYLAGAKRASCIQTSCRHVTKSKRASCNRASCRYLTGAKRKSCLRKYRVPSRRS